MHSHTELRFEKLPATLARFLMGLLEHYGNGATHIALQDQDGKVFAVLLGQAEYELQLLAANLARNPDELLAKLRQDERPTASFEEVFGDR